MKKYLILWFIILLVVKCGYKEEFRTDPLINSYKVDSVKLTKDIIKSDLNYFLHKYNRKWSQENKKKCIDALYYGQQQFDIDYKIILSIISVESQFNIYAKGRNRNSIDFGLCQINSKYLKHRYKDSEFYLKQYKIKYNDSKYDISKNIFSAFIYLRDISSYSDLIQFSDYISAYNRGVEGSKRRTDNKYYELFLKEYLSI